MIKTNVNLATVSTCYAFIVNFDDLSAYALLRTASELDYVRDPSICFDHLEMKSWCEWIIRIFVVINK